MENILAEWSKSVKVQMILRDMDLRTLAEIIGKSKSHTSAVINGSVLAPGTANAISDTLNIKTAPYAEVKREIVQWGKSVKIAMIERNWKTRDLAEKTGKSRDYIGGLMSGYHVNKTVAHEISELLGISDAPYSNW